MVIPVYSSKTLSSFDVYGEMTWYTCNNKSRVGTRKGQLPRCHSHKPVFYFSSATCTRALFNMQHAWLPLDTSQPSKEDEQQCHAGYAVQTAVSQSTSSHRWHSR